jgi:hypothetical protein
MHAQEVEIPGKPFNQIIRKSATFAFDLIA